MLMIDGVSFEQTQGGLSVSYETVRSANFGTNQYGEQIGTVLGIRVHISITTNEMNEDEVQRLMVATALQKSGFLIEFPFGNSTKTMIFLSEGNRQFTYKYQKFGKYLPSTLSFVSKELITSG